LGVRWGLNHRLAASLSRMLAIVFRFFAQPHVLGVVLTGVS